MDVLSKIKMYNSTFATPGQAAQFYNGLLSVYSNCNKVQKLNETMVEMKTLGIELDHESWMWRVRAAVKANSNDLLKVTNEWLKSLKHSNGLTSNDTQIAAESIGEGSARVIDSLSKDLFSTNDLVCEIFNGFRTQNSSHAAMSAYNSLLKCKELSRDYQKDEKIYSIILGVCARHYSKQNIYSLISDMIKYNIALSENTWKSG